MSKSRFYLPVFAALFVSCSSMSYKDLKEWSAVAIVDGNDDAAQTLVRSTLKQHNIASYMEGSLAYSVMVPKDRLQEAKKAILEKTGSKAPWLIIFPNGPDHSYLEERRLLSSLEVPFPKVTPYDENINKRDAYLSGFNTGWKFSLNYGKGILISAPVTYQRSDLAPIWRAGCSAGQEELFEQIIDISKSKRKESE